MKKRWVSICLVLALIMQLFTFSAFAATPEVVQPYYVAVRSCTVDFSIQNTTLGYSNSLVVVSLRDGYTADVTMELYRISSSSVKSLKVWEDSVGSGVESISHGYYVASGYDYLLEVTLKLYDSNGEYVEIVGNSDTEYY